MDTWDIPSLHIEPRHPKVLRSDDETRLITLVLPAGEELKEHQVHERSYVIVLSGEINAIHGNETVTGGPGFLAHFQPNEAPDDPRHQRRPVPDRAGAVAGCRTPLKARARGSH
jgi:hypothetical protein